MEKGIPGILEKVVDMIPKRMVDGLVFVGFRIKILDDELL